MPALTFESRVLAHVLPLHPGAQVLILGEAPLLARTMAERGANPVALPLDLAEERLPFEDESVDFAIVLSADTGKPTPSLAEVARVLRPEGGLYLGVPHRWRHLADAHAWTVARGRRALQAAGFREVEAYGVRAGNADLRLLVPLDGSRATKWFLVSKCVPSSARGALALRALARAPDSRGALALFPDLGFTARRPAAGSGSPLNDVLTRLRSSLPASGGEASAALAGPVSVVPIASRWAGRVLYAVIPRGRSTPAAILKADTSDRGQLRLRAEHAALERFGDQPALAGRLPMKLGLFSTDTALVLAQSGVPGVALNVLLRRRLRLGARSTRRDHELVTDWLKALRAPRAEGAVIVAAEAIARDLADALPNGLSGRHAIIDGVAAVGESLGPLRVPLVPVHGDLGPSNCLVSGEGLSVVDWEGARREGDPLAEIVLFLNHYARAVPEPDRRLPAREVAFRRAFVGNGWLAEVTDRTWRGQLSELGLPSEAAGYLLVATLARLATGRATTAHAGALGSQRYWRNMLGVLVSARPLA